MTSAPIFGFETWNLTISLKEQTSSHKESNEKDNVKNNFKRQKEIKIDQRDITEMLKEQGKLYWRVYS